MHAPLHRFTFRGAYVGIFLASLAPRPEFRDMLIERRPHLPYATDALDFAASIIDGRIPTGQETMAGDLELICRQLRVHKLGQALSLPLKYRLQTFHK